MVVSGDCFVRFTPTRVGKTSDDIVGTARISGSPPRVWGKLPPRSRGTTVSRFTPTRVGKTLTKKPLYLFLNRFTPTRVGKTYG